MMPRQDAALTEDDRNLLRACLRMRPLVAGFGIFIVTLFVLCAVLMISLGLMDSFHDLGTRLALIAFGLILAALAIFFGRRLLRMPASGRLLKLAVQGRLPKQIVSGVLTGFERGDKPGVIYVLDQERIEVALPVWNEVMTDTNLGQHPVAASARADVEVSLHLLPLLPGSQPLLLQACYAGAPDTRSVEAISEDDKRIRRNSNRLLRKVLWGMAGFCLLITLFFPPFIVVTAILAICGCFPSPGTANIKRARHKWVVEGPLDEVLTWKVLSPRQHTAAAVDYHHWGRIGGQLYALGTGPDAPRAGQVARLAFLDLGRRGRQGLSLALDGGPEQEL